MLEQKINEFFGDADATGFGTGWWSGILAVFFGFLALGGVLCLHFPQFLTSAEFRPFYSLPAIRLLIQGLIVAAVAFGAISALLRKKKTLALTGMLLAIAATAWGGSSVKVNGSQLNGMTIGMDWFLLDLLLMALIYVPLERIWPQYPAQGTFRTGWVQDVVYFMSTHLPIQILSFLVLLPATQATKYLGIPALQAFIARMPWILQFCLAVVVADVAEYFIHLALHKVPFLWRFHAIHHSSKALDWIAGSRSHFVDDTLVRGFILVPLMFGFSQSIISGVSDFCDPARYLDALQFRLPTRNGSKSFWSCPDFITGTTLRKKRPSTRTSRFIFRGLISFLGLITFLRSGRKTTAWPATKFRRAFWGKRSNPSGERKDKRKRLKAQRVQGHVFGYLCAGAGGLHQAQIFHRFDGYKSKVIFGFFVT